MILCVSNCDIFRFTVEVVSVSQMTSVEARPPVVTTARLISRESFDREEIEIYQLSILAMDMSERPLNMSIPVTVRILDRNDIQPTFAAERFDFNILENTRQTLVTELMVRSIIIVHTIIWKTDTQSSDQVDLYITHSCDHFALGFFVSLSLFYTYHCM